MNRILILLAFVLAPVALAAQAANGGFETWDSAAGAEKPIGWYGSPFGEGKADQPYEGRYAVSVWNWYYYGRGYLINGPQRSDFLNLNQGGMPITAMPAYLTGYYKFVPGDVQGNTNAPVVVIWMRHYNEQTGKQDTVGYVRKVLGQPTEYTPFRVDIPNTDPSTKPDSIVIAFISSDTGFCNVNSNGNCCYFSIDDVQLVTASGVAYDAMPTFGSAHVYPNPARDALMLDVSGFATRAHRLALYAADGRLVREFEIQGEHTTIGRDGLAAGHYLYEVRDSAGVVLARGRVILE